MEATHFVYILVVTGDLQEVALQDDLNDALRDELLHNVAMSTKRRTHFCEVRDDFVCNPCTLRQRSTHIEGKGELPHIPRRFTTQQAKKHRCKIEDIISHISVVLGSTRSKQSV